MSEETTVRCEKCGKLLKWKDLTSPCVCGSGLFVHVDTSVQSYKRKLIEALEKWQHKDSSLNGYYEILDFIKQWEPGEK